VCRRITVIGRAVYYGTVQDKEYARREIISALENTGGNLAKTAPQLCICLRQLYRIIYKMDMWQEVHRTRKEWLDRWYAEQKRECDSDDWLVRTRKALQNG
jgi:hypothetical protein